jgi:hypothetical protein
MQPVPAFRCRVRIQQDSEPLFVRRQSIRLTGAASFLKKDLALGPYSWFTGEKESPLVR